MMLFWLSFNHWLQPKVSSGAASGEISSKLWYSVSVLLVYLLSPTFPRFAPQLCIEITCLFLGITKIGSQKKNIARCRELTFQILTKLAAGYLVYCQNTEKNINCRSVVYPRPDRKNLNDLWDLHLWPIDTPSHASDHLCQTRKESIQNYTCCRVDMARCTTL